MTSRSRDSEFHKWRLVFDAQTARIMTNSDVTPNSAEGRRVIRTQRSILDFRATRGGISKRRGKGRVGVFTDTAKRSAFRRLEGMTRIFDNQQKNPRPTTQAQATWTVFRITYPMHKREHEEQFSR